MTEIRGILFDKDGTLLDFNSIWIPAANCLIDNILHKYCEFDNDTIRNELFQSIGIEGKNISGQGILASGTVFDIADAFTNVLRKEKKEVFVKDIINSVSESLCEFVKDNGDKVVPIGNLPRLFCKLKNMNIKIGIATSDTIMSTEYCLKTLGIFEHFDFIGTSDGKYNPKPSPELIHNFCKVTGLKEQEVAIVGDTITDMEFAKNGKAGLAVGVLSGTSNLEQLKNRADLVYKSVEDIVKGNALFPIKESLYFVK